MKLKRCDNFNLDFQALVTQLDAELALRDGDDHAFYHQFNGINQLKNVVVAYDDKGRPVACGAFKKRSATQVEIKRMFTTNTARKKGHAKLVLSELERWAAELNYAVAVLETGKAQIEALSFYPKKRLLNYIQFCPLCRYRKFCLLHQRIKKEIILFGLFNKLVYVCKEFNLLNNVYKKFIS